MQTDKKSDALLQLQKQCPSILSVHMFCTLTHLHVINNSVVSHCLLIVHLSTQVFFLVDKKEVKTEFYCLDRRGRQKWLQNVYK